ncbi:MAG: AAA family ATPase, partial [Methylococcales bacterium]|nr:AAA family ATPase [Methylococcales bacterium]
MHTFKNFKNFADVEIDLSKPMTLLIGRNGSGKSNLIEGVELLSELIKGRLIDDISDLGRRSKFEIRGGLKGCLKKGEKKVSMGFEYSNKLNNKIDKFKYISELTINRYIKSESRGFINDTLIFSNENSDEIEIKKDAAILLGMGVGALIGGAPIGYIGWGLAFLLNKKIYPKLKLKESIEREFETHVFDIHPHLMRNYEDKIQIKLSKNGSNLSSVLYYLQQKSPDILQKILERIKEFPEEPIIKFDFIQTPDDVLFEFQYENKLKINAKLLSDGTLRALAILTALETVPEGSRVIIEEIDNGIHASRTKVLLDAIWETSNRRRLNTLITTHNSATLDGLNDEQLACVVVCHYDKASQSSKLTPLFELPNAIELL